MARVFGTVSAWCRCDTCIVLVSYYYCAATVLVLVWIWSCARTEGLEWYFTALH